MDFLLSSCALNKEFMCRLSPFTQYQLIQSCFLRNLEKLNNFTVKNGEIIVDLEDTSILFQFFVVCCFFSFFFGFVTQVLSRCVG